MMSELLKKACEACRVGAPKATEEEVRDFLPQIPEWKVSEISGVEHLVRIFHFDDFVSALSFTNRLAALAEAESHHPAILTEWGRVEVSWWTHKIKGLHVNDFIMAAKTDLLCG